MSGWGPVLLPSCLPSTRPLPGAFFPVSFSAINSGVSPRSGSSREQEEASPYGRFKQHPPLPGEEAERAFSCPVLHPARAAIPQAEVTFPSSRHLPCSPSPLSQGDFSDKQRNGLARLPTFFQLRLIQPLPFHTSNLTTSPAENAGVVATDRSPSAPTHLQSHSLVLAGGWC